MNKIFLIVAAATLSSPVLAGPYVNVETNSSFTGSDYGAGALIVGESSATGHADLSGGGRVNLAHLTVGVQYDFSLTEVACNAKTVYVLKRNPKIT